MVRGGGCQALHRDSSVWEAWGELGKCSQVSAERKFPGMNLKSRVAAWDERDESKSSLQLHWAGIK